MTQRALLILACSRAKRFPLIPGQGSASDVYDGPAFRVWRRWYDDSEPGMRRPALFILSARYGLISEFRWVTDYDQMMTPARAADLSADTPTRTLYSPIEASVSKNPRPARDHFGPYCEVFVFGGDSYRRVVAAWEAAGLFRGAPVTYARGAGIGVMLGQLKAWLGTIGTPNERT